MREGEPLIQTCRSEVRADVADAEFGLFGANTLIRKTGSPAHRRSSSPEGRPQMRVRPLAPHPEPRRPRRAVGGPTHPMNIAHLAMISVRFRRNHTSLRILHKMTTLRRLRAIMALSAHLRLRRRMQEFANQFGSILAICTAVTTSYRHNNGRRDPPSPPHPRRLTRAGVATHNVVDSGMSPDRVRYRYPPTRKTASAQPPLQLPDVTPSRPEASTRSRGEATLARAPQPADGTSVGARL